jgi:hypothetical protein
MASSGDMSTPDPGDEHETCKLPDSPSLAHGPSRRQPQLFGDGVPVASEQ